MSEAHASTHSQPEVDRSDIATRAANTVTALEGTPGIVHITAPAGTRLNRSIFYHDGNERIYYISPAEHPAVVGLIDTVADELAGTHGLDIERPDVHDGYILRVGDGCRQCRADADPPGRSSNPYFPACIDTQLKTCPFNATGQTCKTALTGGAVTAHTTTGQRITDDHIPSLQEITDTVLRSSRTGEGNQDAVLASNGVTIAQPTIDTDIAALFSILDCIASIRTCAVLPSNYVGPVTTASPDPPQHLKRDGVCTDEFESHREDFLTHTPPGSRYRWVMSALDSPCPAANIADAASITGLEACVTSRLLDEWGILTSSLVQPEPNRSPCGARDRAYCHSPIYTEWRESNDLGTYREAEPAFLAAETESVRTAIQSAHAVLASL